MLTLSLWIFDDIMFFDCVWFAIEKFAVRHFTSISLQRNLVCLGLIELHVE